MSDATTAAPVNAAPFPPAELKDACESLIARYPTRVAALIPILHLAQKHFDNWISPEVEAGVAKYLDVSPAHVRGVLTFYSMYNTKPAGKHEVWICRTLTGWLRGADDLRKTALDKAGLKHVGDVGEDGKFLVKNMECLGLCEQAPAVFVDGEPHMHVTCEKLAELMEGCD